MPTSYVPYGSLYYTILALYGVFSLVVLGVSRKDSVKLTVKYVLCITSLCMLLISCFLYHQWPLHICHVTIWLVIPLALLFNRNSFQLIMVCLSGWCALLGILLPELADKASWVKVLSYFILHGNIVLASWYVFLYQRPVLNMASVVRVLIAFTIYVFFIGVIDYFFHVNYVYLAHAPSILMSLSWVAPWPWYILQAEGVVIVLAMFTVCCNKGVWLLSEIRHHGVFFFERWVRR